MTDTVIVALIAFIGTAIGSISGVLATAKKTEWRLQQLEIKVDKHNTLVERMTRCESDIGALKAEVGRHGAD